MFLKKSLFAIALFATSIGVASADEGMWLPALVKQLNISDMRSKGFKLTADELYSVNNSSLKDAIVAINFGSCTGEIISDQGLMLTNHHCGFGDIQRHSSVENNYLRDGFWAATKGDELANPDKNVSFLIEMKDVTDKMLEGTSGDLTKEERTKKLNENRTAIEKDAKGDSHYRVKVSSLFNNNVYYLFVYETYTDVRLVGAPPSSIGKFGGDTDNWMWPRHTGDFSMFRVYTGPDGKPADYSEDNIPLKPKHHLPISINGVKEGDFAMILGYPGSTNRYLSSWGVENTMEITNTIRRDVRGVKLAIVKEYMKTSAEARLKYASKAAGSSNYWKYSIGQNKGLKNLDVVAKKQAIEARFSAWVKEDSSRGDEYGEVLKDLKSSYQNYRDAESALSYIYEGIYRGPEIIYFAGKHRAMLAVLKSGDETKISAVTEKYLESIEDGKIKAFYKDYDQETDRKVVAALSNLLNERVSDSYKPQFLVEVNSDGGDYDKYSQEVFKKSIFASSERLKEFMEKPSFKKLSKDPALVAYIGTSEIVKKIKGELAEKQELLADAEKLFLKGLMAMDADKDYYPDANSTMRLTYGRVGGYVPRDGVVYDYYTTIDGYKEKGVPGDVEFDVPPRLKELYERSSYGRYGDEDGNLRTCFISNNDITGGNSGSPVINGNGELIGCAFDGNWEAMSGDIAFEPALQRCINVDIRFVLWVIDEYAGASHLVDEMTIR